MKIRSIAFVLLTSAFSLQAAPSAAEQWAALPPEIARDVDAYFTTMDLALNNNRIELVMNLYTPDATEEIQVGQGAKFNVAQIRQRRQADMQRYAQTGKGAQVINRANLRYQPSAKPDTFLIRYMIFRPGAEGSGSPSAEIIYEFRRGDRGILISSMLARQVGATPPQPPASKKFNVGRNGLPIDVELTNGVMLRQATVVQWLPDKVVIKHVGGTDPIKFDRIIPEQRAMFESRLEHELTLQKMIYDRAAQVNDAQQQVRVAQQKTAQAEADLQEQLEAAVGQHRLLVGMTKDQVKRSWGPPNRTATVDGTDGRGLLWIYEGRGVDDKGVPANAGIGFSGEIVLTLFNVKH